MGVVLFVSGSKDHNRFLPWWSVSFGRTCGLLAGMADKEYGDLTTLMFTATIKSTAQIAMPLARFFTGIFVGLPQKAASCSLSAAFSFR